MDVVVIVEVAVAEKGGEHVSYETAACGCLPPPTVRSSVYAPWQLSSTPFFVRRTEVEVGRSDTSWKIGCDSFVPVYTNV